MIAEEDLTLNKRDCEPGAFGSGTDSVLKALQVYNPTTPFFIEPGTFGNGTYPF